LSVSKGPQPVWRAGCTGRLGRVFGLDVSFIPFVCAANDVKSPRITDNNCADKWHSINSV
ncbi:MAG: hypothetical protein ACPHI0_11820, partial [Paracoccaceae bacterium]